VVETLRITVLAENTVRGSKLLAEHGLAFWIEADGHSILFDTGQGLVLRHNAEQLGIPLEKTEKLVLSHRHFDHVGGLADVFDAAGAFDLYLHPDAMGETYHRRKEPPHRSIGMSEFDEVALGSHARRLVWTRGPTEVVEDVYVTGEIPRLNDFEDTGGPFFADAACETPDPLYDDQALYIRTPAGIVVILGCAHSGVVNTLDYIAELTGCDRIHSVMGGMHLVRASNERLEKTVEALRKHKVASIGAAHCTGMRATSYLWSQLPDACFECCVGVVIDINR
jgi:7,8-dihydropterin-6-yl-methyl-4-(beta-D-ribofuranosyl)aminobenzene 5'-phosphate synthase